MNVCKDYLDTLMLCANPSDCKSLHICAYAITRNNGFGHKICKLTHNFNYYHNSKVLAVENLSDVNKNILLEFCQVCVVKLTFNSIE